MCVITSSFHHSFSFCSFSQIVYVQIENHELDKKLMEKVKQLINIHYEENLKENFYQSEIAKSLDKKQKTSDIDWESAFFIWHRPVSNIRNIPNLSEELRWVNLLNISVVFHNYNQ